MKYRAEQRAPSGGAWHACRGWNTVIEFSYRNFLRGAQHGRRDDYAMAAANVLHDRRSNLIRGSNEIPFLGKTCYLIVACRHVGYFHLGAKVAPCSDCNQLSSRVMRFDGLYDMSGWLIKRLKFNRSFLRRHVQFLVKVKRCGVVSFAFSASRI